MKPPRFEYHDPSTLPEALSLLGEYGDDAKLLAGGQSLVPLMNMRLAQPEHLVDLNRIEGLDYLRHENGTLVAGALARQRALEDDPGVAERYPLIADAVRVIAHPQIRNRGTICGNLAHADPSSELPAIALALGAEFVARSAKGERRLSAEDFYVTVLTTTLEPTEVLAEVRISAPPKGSGSAFLELSRRHGDYAIVGVAAVLRLDENGAIDHAALGVCGAAPTPIKPREAERFLLGQRPSLAVFDEAGALAAQASDPAADVHATAEYRRAMVRVFTKRTLGRALERAGGGAVA